MLFAVKTMSYIGVFKVTVYASSEIVTKSLVSVQSLSFDRISAGDVSTQKLLKTVL